jgi:hypothetical protein
MVNILVELVRVHAFQSKSEARMMIKNGGVSVIPCINEDYEVPCFEVEIPGGNWENMSVDCRHFIEPVPGEKQLFFEGFVLSPTGEKIPAKMWDVRDIRLKLLHFREHLMHDTKNDFYSLCIPNPWSHPKAWQNATMCVITWDKQFGKNPWLINEKTELKSGLKDGDVIKIGKRRTIVIGEEHI